MQTIGLCADHAGYPLKETIKRYLIDNGYEVKDFGTYSEESCDYSDYAHPCAFALEEGTVYPAIAVCGTGNGIGMTLNKHQGVRAALCWVPEIARLARAHNDANCLVLPGRFIDEATALECLRLFLTTPFEGGRHQRRLDKMPVK